MSELYEKLLAEATQDRSTPAPAKATKPAPASVPDIDAETPLCKLAQLIKSDPAYEPCRWCAEPYRAALAELHDIGESYGADSGKMVVAYLVSNLAQYRGPRARQIKAELRRRLKHA